MPLERRKDKAAIKKLLANQKTKLGFKKRRMAVKSEVTRAKMLQKLVWMISRLRGQYGMKIWLGKEGKGKTEENGGEKKGRCGAIIMVMQ